MADPETVFITKYALTEGIRECVVLKSHGMRPDGITVAWPGGPIGGAYFWRLDWHRTREAARARAEEMRKAKIASYEKSIAKLRRLNFAEGAAGSPA